MREKRDVLYRLDLFASVNGGEKVPFVVDFCRVALEDDNKEQFLIVTCVDGVIKRERSPNPGGPNDFQMACLGMWFLKIELEFFFIKKGYRLYRKVAVEGGGEEYCEVGLEDLFPYAEV